MKGFLLYIILSIIINIGYCGTCLSQPPELEWTYSNGIYYGELNYDVKTFYKSDGYPTTFRTRVHNDMLPSPTLRMSRNNSFYLTLNNNLGDESPTNPTEHNVIKDLNTTNLHTHGLHISGESPADDIFIDVAGGESHTYEYNFPCDHAGGTFWYHPHHHGSTAVQVGSGAAGAVIVDDSSELEGYPDWLTNMDELILMIQHVNLNTVKIFAKPRDNVFTAGTVCVCICM